MASINRDRDHHHPGGARAAVHNDPAAPGQLEDHLRTIRESAFLLDDTLRSGLDRGSEGADTSLRAAALTSSAMSRDQHASCTTTSVIGQLAHAMQGLVVLLAQSRGGAGNPADFKDAISCPIQGAPLAQLRDAASLPADLQDANSCPTQGAPLAQPRDAAGLSADLKDADSCPIQGAPLTPPRGIASPPADLKDADSCPIQGAPLAPPRGDASIPVDLKDADSSQIPGAT